MSARHRVIIADDHTLVAELCQRLLEPEFDVVSVVTNGRDLVSAAVDIRPDVILVDIAMPEMNGFEAAARLKAVLREVKVVYLTMNSDPLVAMRALEEGASGYILKNCAASELLLAIRSIVQGRKWISPVLRDAVEHLRLENATTRPKVKLLTPRQREVLQLLAAGKKAGQIAKTLGVTLRTIYFHKYEIMRVVGVKNNADLVKYALRNELQRPFDNSLDPN
jgi:DNA-binding NarL/FixJ family response regulator